MNETNSTNKSIRFSNDRLKQIVDRANEIDRSVNWVVNDACAKYLESDPLTTEVLPSDDRRQWVYTYHLGIEFRLQNVVNSDLHAYSITEFLSKSVSRAEGVIGVYPKLDLLVPMPIDERFGYKQPATYEKIGDGWKPKQVEDVAFRSNSDY